MLKVFLFSLTALFSLLAVEACAQQTSGALSLANGWGKFYIGATVEPLAISSTDIQFTYIDESPSVDPLVADVSLNSGKIAYGLNVGMEFSYPSGITWSFDGTFTTNAGNNLSGANLGLGYRFKLSDRFFVIPVANAGIGNGNFKLGDIQNISTYIQVNETQFYSKEVNVKLRDQYGYVAPGLNVFIPVNNKWGIQFGGSYKYAFNRGEKISFRGYSDSDESERAKDQEKLSEDNVHFYLDGQRIRREAKLIDFGGFKGQASVVFFVGR
ncbi:MAG: hypothetical protein J5I98_32725 [Phaeodactylibacter sp.]|nr:hypothetical protein [Phaeodactylibacter sp.]